MSKADTVLPVHRKVSVTRRARIGHSGTGGRWDLFGHPENNFWRRVKRVACWFTLTQDGSLSETFRLSGTDTSDAGDNNSVTVAALNKEAQEQQKPYLDAIVVDNDAPSLRQTNASDPGSRMSTSNRQSSNGQYGGGGTYYNQDDASYYQGGFVSFMRWRFWPALASFFEPRMEDPAVEEDYQKQFWHSNKYLSLMAVFFLILNWALYLALNREVIKASLYSQIAFWGPFTALTVPLPFLVGANMYRTHPIIFQIWLACATWYCAYAELVEIRLCGFFSLVPHCHDKPFLATNYYSTALPILMMFICSKRLYNAVAQLGYFALVSSLILPIRPTYSRNAICFFIFYIFTQYLSYNFEKNSRQMFLLALQLKHAYKGKHKAQVAESKAGYAKRRFANYIFHEVRVPLNNALLAFQLLQSENAFQPDHVESTEVQALNHGLNLMSTVLNDVLDFEKMDSGHFEQTIHPFPLHRTISTMLDLIQVQSSSRQIRLIRNLDPAIDGLSSAPSFVDGLWVMGSDLRLQQLLSNLATNAVKYAADENGEVEITTKLLGVTEEPEDPPDPVILDDGSGTGSTSEGNEMEKKAVSVTPQQKRNIVTVRLEIRDNGHGIKPSDIVDHRLFQPFAVTTYSKGSGMGTGLGLAIAREIVKNSGGRLGVMSKRGEGTTFWVELPYVIASQDEVEHARNAKEVIQPALVPKPPVHVTLSPPTTTSTPTTTIMVPAAGVAPPPSLRRTTTTNHPLRALVCDDDHITRELARRLLTKLGCSVDVASDGQECLDMVEATAPNTYHLICLDNFMPVLTGEEAIREMRCRGRPEYVVGCTGNALTEDQESYRRAGADDILIKPISISSFKKVIKEAETRRATQTTPPSAPQDTLTTM